MECGTCKKPVDGTCVQVAGLVYHHECFLCGLCSAPLDCKVFKRDGKLICSACNYPSCCKCEEPILDQQVSALGKNWHVACFCCSLCGAEFEGGRYVKREADQLPYCTSCFDDHYAPRCYGCKNLAKSGALSALGERWHPACLVCTTCRTPLPGKAIFKREGMPYCQAHASQPTPPPRRPTVASTGLATRRPPVGPRPKSTPPIPLTAPSTAQQGTCIASSGSPCGIASSADSSSARGDSGLLGAAVRTMSDTCPRTDADASRPEKTPSAPSSPRSVRYEGGSISQEDVAGALALLVSDKGKPEKASKGPSRAQFRPLGRSLSEVEPPQASPSRRKKKASKDGPRSAKLSRRIKNSKEQSCSRPPSGNLRHSRDLLKMPSPSEARAVTTDSVATCVTSALERLPWFKEKWTAEQDAQKQQVLADLVNGLRSLGVEIVATQVMKKEWAKMENDLSFRMPPKAVQTVAAETKAIQEVLTELLEVGMKIAEPVAVAASSKTLLQSIGGSPPAESRRLQEKAVELREHFKAVVALVRSHCSEELVSKPLDSVLKAMEEAPLRGRAKQHAINAKKDMTGARARHHVALRLRGHLERLMSLVRQTCNTLSTVDSETGSMLHRTALELLAATQVIVKLTVKVQDLCATAQGLVLKARESAGNLLKRSMDKTQQPPKKKKNAECNVWHFAPDENVRSNWPEGAATLNSLVLALTSTEKIVDRSFLQAFILTYRSFTSPERLLAKLMERYNVPRNAREDKPTVQLRVCVTLKYWIENQIRDFSPELVDQLRLIIEQKLPADGNERVAKMLQTALDNHIAAQRDSYEGSILPLQTASILDAPISPTDMLMNSTERDIAEQLTLISWEIFSAIDLHELLNGAWSNVKTRHTAPHVIRLIKRFNQISFWVASTVLYSESLKERSMLISRWIKIAMKLRALNNFDGLMGVIAGLTLSPIDRLKFSKSTVHGELMERFDGFVTMMQPTNNWKLYREELAAAPLPKIPYLGMYLTDLIYIGDGNPDTLENGKFINFRKRQMVFKVLDEIAVQQSKPYDIKPLQPLTGCLLGLPALTEDQLYELSLKREPRGANMADVLR